MANVLDKEKREQILALGRLGWPLRRIEEATGIRREAVQALDIAAVDQKHIPARLPERKVKARS